MRKSNRERGIALIVVLFALMVLTAVGLGLMYMTDTETSVSGNFRSEQQAYYASKAGLEEGRDRLRFDAVNAIAPSKGWVLPTTTPGGGYDSVVYILNSAGTSDSVTPWTYGTTYFDDELCHENFSGLGMSTSTTSVPCTSTPSGSSWYTTTTSTDPNTGTSSATPYKWVRITLKQDQSTGGYCSDGQACTAATSQVCLTANPNAPYNPPYFETPLPSGYTICEADNMRSVYMVTSLARLPNGSRKMTQYEVASIVLPPLPSAITFDGSNPLFESNGIVGSGAPPSNAMSVSGTDYHNPSSTTADSCSSPYAAPAQPALGAYDAGSVNTLTTDVSGRTSNYTGAGTSPSINNVSSQLGSLSTVGGLQTLVSNVTSSADQVFGNNPSGVNLGTTTAPKITVVNGDFNMGNTAGAGLLVVTGTLYMSGNPTFSGVILVVGKGNIQKSGGGSGNFYGGILVANLYDSTGNLLPPSSPPGVPTINWAGGGTVNIYYDSCWINNLSQHLTLKVVASHEEVY